MITDTEKCLLAHYQNLRLLLCLDLPKANFHLVVVSELADNKPAFYFNFESHFFIETEEALECAQLLVDGFEPIEKLRKFKKLD